MAENVVEIVVRSKNDVKGGFDAAKLEAETAGDEAAQGFLSRFGQRMSSSFGSSATGGGGFLSSIAGIATSSPEGFAAVAVAVAAVAAEVTALTTGLVAATLGVGAFGLVALPTFDKIKNAYTGISTAQTAYNAALALEKEFPTKAHATAAAAALQKLQVAQEAAGPGISGAVAGIQQLAGAFEKMAASFQPQVLAIFNQGLKLATALLPAVKQLAAAAAPAIMSVMQSFAQAVSGPGFKAFINQMASVAPVAIKQLGSLLGMVAKDLAQFLSLMGKQDVYNAFRIAIDGVDVVLKGVMLSIKLFMTVWDVAWDLMHGRTVAAGNAIQSFVAAIPKRIEDDLHSLPGMLVKVGENAIQGLIDGMASMVGRAVSQAASWAHDIANAVGMPFGIHFSEPSEASLMVKAGQRAGQGFLKGLRSGPGLGALALGGLGGYGTGGRGGMEVVLSLDPSFAAALNELSPALLRAVRGTVRIKGGGSVQQAFGKAGHVMLPAVSDDTARDGVALLRAVLDGDATGLAVLTDAADKTQVVRFLAGAAVTGLQLYAQAIGHPDPDGAVREQLLPFLTALPLVE